MALRFRKSFKVAPEVRVNLSKSGIGMSAGVRGARVGIKVTVELTPALVSLELAFIQLHIVNLVEKGVAGHRYKHNQLNRLEAVAKYFCASLA